MKYSLIGVNGKLNILLNSYCKYKKVKLFKTQNSYTLIKQDKRFDLSLKIADIEIKENVLIKYKNGIKEQLSKEEFIQQLSKELKQMKLLRKFKANSRPVKWQKSQHRNKLTEIGRVNLRSYMYRQNLKSSEAYSIKELSK
jgi:hypothetical protein